MIFSHAINSGTAFTQNTQHFEQKSYTRNIPGNNNRKLAHQLPRVAHSAHNREKSRRQLRARAWPPSQRLRSSQAHLRRPCTPPSVFAKTAGVASPRDVNCRRPASSTTERLLLLFATPATWRRWLRDPCL